MSFARFRQSLFVSVSALGLIGLSGCGGSGPNVDEAIIVSAPEATNPTAAPTGGTAPTPAAGSTATEATPTAATPAAATASVSAEGWGTLKGRVVLNGPDPKFPPLDGSAKDPEVCAKEVLVNERLVVGPDNGIKYALVYIPKPTSVNPDAKTAAQSASVDFDQEKCVFKPHVLAAMTGATIKIKSSDVVGHNVNSSVDNNTFNDAVANGQEIDKTIKAAARKPGLVVCNVHPWMTAYWLILDNPYFAVTDANGNYEIKNAPAGTQKVVVWQEAAAFVTPTSGVDVTIAANGETTKDFSVDATKVKK